MKSFKDLCWDVPETVYREDKAFSYSTLSRFLREGFSNKEHLFDKISSPALTFGSMVDTLVTDGQEAFDERFFVATMPSVPDNIETMVKTLYERFGNVTKQFSEVPDKEILAVCNENDYGKTWKNETKVAKVRDAGSIYYNMLGLTEGKELVSSEMYNDAKRCCEALKTSEATAWYFAQDNPFDGIERFYQLKIKGTWQDIDLRCMVDLLIVNHKNKTIQPCDLKTTGHPEYEFFKSYVKWNYNIQQSLYTYLIKQLVSSSEDYKDYKVLPYKFIVVNKTNCRPEVWEVNQYMADAEVDFVLGDTEFKNWRSIAKELKVALEPNRTVPDGIVEVGNNSIKDWILKTSKTII